MRKLNLKIFSILIVIPIIALNSCFGSSSNNEMKEFSNFSDNSDGSKKPEPWYIFELKVDSDDISIENPHMNVIPSVNPNETGADGNKYDASWYTINGSIDGDYKTKQDEINAKNKIGGYWYTIFFDYDISKLSWFDIYDYVYYQEIYNDINTTTRFGKNNINAIHDDTESKVKAPNMRYYTISSRMYDATTDHPGYKFYQNSKFEIKTSYVETLEKKISDTPTWITLYGVAVNKYKYFIPNSVDSNTPPKGVEIDRDTFVGQTLQIKTNSSKNIKLSNKKIFTLLKAKFYLSR